MSYYKQINDKCGLPVTNDTSDPLIWYHRKRCGNFDGLHAVCETRLSSVFNARSKRVTQTYSQVLILTSALALSLIASIFQLFIGCCFYIWRITLAANCVEQSSCALMCSHSMLRHRYSYKANLPEILPFIKIENKVAYQSFPFKASLWHTHYIQILYWILRSVLENIVKTSIEFNGWVSPQPL